MNKSHTWGGGGGSGVLKPHILHFIKSPSERLNPQSAVLSVCSNEDIISRSADSPSEDAGLVSDAVIT